MTMKNRIKQHLERKGSITTNEAFRDLGCTRLSEYIRQLREEGMDIETVNISGINRFGEKTHYGRYELR